MDKKREVIIPLIAATFHGIILLFMSSWIFKAPVFKLSEIENKWQAVFCYFAALCVLYVFYWLLFEIMFVKNKDFLEWSKYSGIYFCVLLIFFFLIYPMQSVGGDVDYFISLAVNYDMNWDLYYVSSLFYIVPMMIFPSYIAPSIFQMLILAFAVGYCVYRGRRHVRKWYLLYLPFLLLPVIYYAHFINRPPVYTSLYLVLITVLIFDYYENEKLSMKKLLFIYSVGGGIGTLEIRGDLFTAYDTNMACLGL